MDPAATYAQAVSALNAADFPRAYALSMALVRQLPQHGGVHFVAGVAALHLGQMPQAIDLLGRACAFSPARPDYHAQRARALAIVRAFREALEAADRAWSLGPADPMTSDTVGVVYTQANEHRKAAQAFARAVEEAPRVASFRFNLATALTFLGELDAAESEYEACLALDPRYWKAHLALSQLRRQQPASNHLERLRALLADAHEEPQARMYVNLALSKELEDLQRYAEAFTHLVAGKRAGIEGRDYRFERDRALFDALIETFDGAPTTEGSDSHEPIFVIGMPRSGTTLVDRILSSHPDVHSAGELQNFGVVVKRLSGSRTDQLIDPETVRLARNVPPRAIGEAYVASTRPGTAARPRFTDKLPHNFLYAGFIASALPRARIVCVLRDPMDTCLSNFRQLFAQSSPYYDYSFDPVTTARYYVEFRRLVDHWLRLWPERFHVVQYEALVANQRRETEALLAACELTWDERCMSFQDNDAPVATASAVQVREPLNARSIGRWRRYAAEIGTMRRVLEDAGIPLESA